MRNSTTRPVQDLLLSSSQTNQKMASDAIGSPSGAQLAAAAYALPPLTPKGLSLGIVVFSILFAIITTAVACLRIWVRMGMSGSITRTWGVEDYFFVLGFVSCINSRSTMFFPATSDCFC